MKKNVLMSFVAPVLAGTMLWAFAPLVGQAQASTRLVRTSSRTTSVSVACSGTTLTTSDNIVNKISSASSGTTFCLQSGTYSIGSSAVLPKANDKLIGTTVVVGSDGSIAAGTKIVGTGNKIIDVNKSNGVVIQNLDVSGATGSSGCKPSCGRGISEGDNLTISYTRVHGNANSGIGGGGDGAKLSHLEVDHNGSSTFQGCCAGGVKAAHSYTIDHSYVHDNVGNGVWLDVCGTNWVVTNNTITGNLYSGVRFEHNQVCPGTAKITSNVVKNNNTVNSYGAAGIMVNSAPGANIAYNVLGSNQKYGVAVTGTRGPTTGTSINNSTLNADLLKGCTLSGVTCTNNY